MTPSSAPTGGPALRVAVLDDYQRVAARMADWSALGPDVAITYFHDHVPSADQLVQRLAGYDVVVAMRERTPFPRALLERLDDVKVIVTKGMVNAAIDVEAAHDCGITVCGTDGWSGVPATVELTWALILACARDLPAEEAGVRAGAWQRSVGVDLAGAVLGIVGLGNIGPLMAPVARAFGMRVVAWSRNLTDERAAEVGIERLDHDTFFSTADVVTVHLKLSDRSRGYISADELRLMKPTALLINTSRGPIVDQAALVDALTTGSIGGAGLDVFDEEPLPRDHPLLRTPHTVLTPHIGYVTARSYRDHFTQVVEVLAALRRGEIIRRISPAPAG